MPGGKARQAVAVERKEITNGGITIKDKGLRELPPWLTEPHYRTHLRSLALTKNVFEELPAELRKFGACERVSFNGNRIGRLNAGALPPSVTALEVVNNRMTSIDPAALAELPRLAQLDLCANLLDREKLEEVTPAICACRHLGFLDLSANRLSELPSALVLPRVFELRLSLNPLRTLPPMVAQSRELHTLVIARCGLTELPTALLELPSLATLDAGRNELTSLPEVRAKHLKVIRAPFNRLGALPASLAKSRMLTELEFAHNEIVDLPDGLADLPLEIVHLEHNHIRALPAAWSKLASRGGLLQEFRLEHNRLEKVPDVCIGCVAFSLGHNPLGSLACFSSKKFRMARLSAPAMRLESLPPLSGIEELELPANDLSALPWESIAECARSLRVLNVAQNRITALPAEIGSLGSLCVLIVSYNRLASLPQSVGALRSLEILAAAGNELAEVPPPALELTRLKWLHLGANRIGAVPPAIVGLAELQCLLLNDNEIAEIADVVFPDSLVELDLSHNHIAAVPDDFAIPNSCDTWLFKFNKEPPHKSGAPPRGGGGGLCCGAKAAADVIEPAPAEGARTRRPHKLPKSMQPFRMYVHGNPCALPAPRLLAHDPRNGPPPDAADAPDAPPPPLSRHPRGSGMITVDEYDGCVWPSEAALHTELLRTPEPDAPASRVRVGVAEAMLRRLRMEDAVYVHRRWRGRPDEALFAVFDAHSGSDVAEQGCREYGAELARQLGDGPLPARDEVLAAMSRTYLDINRRMLEIEVVGGATAVVVLLQFAGDGRATLYSANVGDARGVLSERGAATRFSRDFKPFDADEYARIQGLGGFVSLRDGGRVCDDLALSRALGDAHISTFVEPLAHVNAIDLDVDATPFLILACDGVWDVLSDQQAVDAVAAQAPHYERGAAALRDLAFAHGSDDNVSALVIDLTPLARAGGDTLQDA